MGMTVNTNVSALNAYRNLSNTQNDLSKSLARLSSGLRINSAADDAAGMAISQGLQSQVGGLQVAARNAQDGINVVQTADGALNEVQTILQRMRDLAVQGANDSNDSTSRAAIKTEGDELGQELYRITNNTSFNGIDLLKGGTLNFQVGAGSTDNDAIKVSLADVATAVGGLASADGTAAQTGLDVTDITTAHTSIDTIDTAITAISTARAKLGASQNRLESAVRSVNITQQNLTAAKSTITDTDMASEMANYSRSNILAQAGTAMLAQANQSTSSVLQLLRG
jgi:flagellin